MKKILMFIALLNGISCCKSFSQKRYGYTVLNFRCGDNDPQRNRVYFSPVIELNALNFPRYTDGIDTAIPQFSVRYYNYAISKWFEIYLWKKHKILVNTPDRYARKSTSVIYNDENTAGCNDDKTNSGCFFMDKEELSIKRMNAINESRSPEYDRTICEVIDL
jgi:hypothetical protein